MGCWLAGRLMKELGLVSCQQPTHRYKRVVMNMLLFLSKRGAGRERVRQTIIITVLGGTNYVSYRV
ncbi:putative transposase [Escherichia coli BCE007_MS-11]|nr:putative transposase [Escherichia coli BCE007_MS-11]